MTYLSSRDLAGEGGLAQDSTEGRPLPWGVVTFVFSDVVSSTTLWEARQEAMSKAMSRHDELIAEAVAQHNGYLPVAQGEGDSAVMVFDRASRAAACAIWLQRRFMDEQRKGFDLKVRMGLHSGEAEVRQGNYYGPAVNRGARLRDIANGGQILVSEACHMLIRDSLPEGAFLFDLGDHRLKDLSRPERVWQLSHRDIRSDHPPLVSLQAISNNFPVQLTSFVNREQEMAALQTHLDSGNRLVTLIGGGGLGKTRLALQACAEVLEEYPDGIWLVDLAPLRDSDLIAQQAAYSVGLRELPPAQIGEELGTQEYVDINDELVEYLRSKNLVMILDNCEHVISGCAEFAENLLRACPEIRILATSREPLRIAGEILLSVPPLSMPTEQPAVDELEDYPSLRLFVDRALSRRPDFTVTVRNVGAVIEVCKRLEGVPLAIELAAARLSALTPDQLASRLDDRLGMLVGGPRGQPRHETLRAVIDWSYELLSERERVVFRQLSIFVGTFSLEATEAICSTETIGALEVIDVLFEIVNKSLISATEVDGSLRYSMLETVRQYAREKLEEASELNMAQARHIAWYLELTERASRELIGPDQVAWLDLLENEHENLRAAIRRAVDSNAREEALRFGGALWLFWGMRGYLTEGRRLIDDVLGLEVSQDIHRGRALRGAGVLARYQADYAAARQFLEESASIASALGSRTLSAECLLNLGYVDAAQGRYAEAQEHLEQALALNREISNRWGAGIALITLAHTMVEQGNYVEARAPVEEAVALMRELRDRWGLGYALNTLASIEMA